ncbi:MAG: efflux RND transporter periplasmic adaptor subunit [Chloroflexota bacterium]
MSAFFKNKNVRVWGSSLTLLLAGLLAWWFFVQAAPASASADSANTVTVASIDLAETIEVSGELKTQPFASLSWKTGGVVETVHVQPGDWVKAGDLLVTLQPESASASLVSAQADLEAARADLQALTAPDGSSVGGARESVASAFDAWDNAREDLMDEIAYNKFGGDDELYADVVDARDDLSAAIEDYPLLVNPGAQFYYWAARAESQGHVGEYDYAALAASLRAELGAADAQLVDEILAKQAGFEAQAAAFAASLEDQDDAIQVMKELGAYEKSADALLDALESAYGVLVEPSRRDLVSAQARVDAAQASVNTLSIIAPFDGQVLSVNDRVGDTVSAGQLSVNLADMNHLYVEVQVDETDVAKVQAGAAVEATLDAVPGVTLTGVVASVDPVGETVGGLVKYTVHISLEADGESFLPLGSTTNVVIAVGNTQSTLAVPIVAIQNDSRGEYVWVLRNGSAVRVDVVGGMIHEDMVTVTGDLQPGETLEVVHESSFTPPNPFSGGQK